MERRTTGAELRAEGRSLRGLVLRYGELGDRNERFAPGAFSIAPGAWLNLDHDPMRVVAHGSRLRFRDAPDALRMRADLPPIPAADVALEGVRDGTRTGLSVEFRARRERREPQTGTRVVESAELVGVGLVARPSYDGSRVETRRRTLPGVRGSVALGQTLPCQCRAGCDAVAIAVDAFDEALRELAAGKRVVPLFFTGRYDRPLAREGHGLTIRRRGKQLEVEADGLPDTEDSRSFLETVRAGAAYMLRPYFPDRTSEVRKKNRVAHVGRADLRGIEVAAITGPTDGLQEIEVLRKERERRTRLWL